ncbi:MAG: peptide deformylase [Chloroflexi bacterium]|jgi:peptide deformylase|nr:peptide deformylase [Chloroflexota bacterium]MBT4074761.1 peptide deformylase [Chloroflexota bacterium]MBT4514912.1 peptide deformylase [Chloroflexota bacterium]MBT5319647.1 peptide deformylase [Chloroflexota bacterium]MBT6681914.1 peptide deformylase [Chloroflexota bacterium]
MTLLDIRTVPDPILRRKSRKIREVDDAIRELAHNMVATMHEAHGVGLAAPQVGELKRLIVLQLPDEEDARILVNPEITRRDGEREVEEGCLSVPGFMGTIMRSERVKARAVDEWGAKLRLTAEQIFAQALEHEVDHLDGILYLDHLKSHEDLIDLSKLEEEEHQHDFEVEVEDEGLMESRGEKRVLTVGDMKDGVAEVKDEKIVEATEQDLEEMSGG